MYRIVSLSTVVLVTAVLLPTPAMGQTGGTVRVIQTIPVMETPRGDSVVVGSAPTGMVLNVLEVRNGWYFVAPPADTPTAVPWRRGWIRDRFLETLTPGAAPAGAPRSQPSQPRDGLVIRGFGQAGGTLFTAQDSFETLLGSALGSVYGAGGQVTFANGLFAQVGIDRFRKTGSRVLVSGEQIFRLGIPHIVTVTPVQVTVGYRDPRTTRIVSYFGGGIGSHAFEETSPDLRGAGDVSDTPIGYHVLGGADTESPDGSGWPGKYSGPPCRKYSANTASLQCSKRTISAARPSGSSSSSVASRSEAAGPGDRCYLGFVARCLRQPVLHDDDVIRADAAVLGEGEDPIVRQASWLAA